MKIQTYIFRKQNQLLWAAQSCVIKIGARGDCCQSTSCVTPAQKRFLCGFSSGWMKIFLVSW